jgi:hypothetical protein
MLRTTYCYLSFATLALSCNERDRPLGDARDASNAGSGGAGSSYDGGGSSSGGTGGAGALAGTDGAGALGGTDGTGALGGTGGTGALGGTSGTGALGGSAGWANCVPRRGAGVPADGGPEWSECFTPYQNADQALSGGRGCPCDRGDAGPLAGAVCVRVNRQDSGPEFISIHCVDGHFAVVAGGICEFGPGTLPAIKVGNYIYPDTSWVQDPTSCNMCWFSDGQLYCEGAACLPRCPAPGMVKGTSCYRCGPADSCDIVEFGWHRPCATDVDCLTVETCHDGMCKNLCG